MKLYLMRHGETDGNKARVLQGRLNNPLNETGRKQAEEAKERIKEISFDAYYVSPLTRALETAMIVTGLDSNQFHIEERIAEISFGSREGHSLEELGHDFQKFFLDPPAYRQAEDAESFEELISRIREFLTELKTKDHEKVLIVSHGAAIHAMFLVIENLKLEDFWSMDVGNCGLTEVTLVNGEWKITKACDTIDTIYGKGRLQE